MNRNQLGELVLQSLEHERGGANVYQAALQCAVNKELREEWQKYLGETKRHATVLTQVCHAMGLDPEQDSPGREVVRMQGKALVDAMAKARKGGKPEAAELVACECVVLAETKDHLDWELIGECASKLDGEEAEALKKAYEEVEDQEDEHLYHTKGWCRELWIQSLGMKAILPPPEETHHVKSAIAAARAEQASARAR